MDERKTTIKELEEKKQADVEARKRLFEGLGETLLRSIGGEEPFADNTGNTPGGILAEYRKLQKEIADFSGTIESLEAEALLLKEKEERISAIEGEQSGHEKELEEINVRVGKALHDAPDVDERLEPLRLQGEGLLAKIEEQEKKLEELEEKEGSIITLLGKNAQMAISKTLLARHRSALQRHYRSAGEKTLSAGQAEALDGEASGRALEINGLLSSLAADLALLRSERRSILDNFGSDGTPSKRIQGIQKQIAKVKGAFPGLYLRLGYLAAEDSGKEALSSFLKEDEHLVLEKAEALSEQIGEKELAIKKVKATISIDDEKAEIEKIKKAISNQRQKIAEAESVIASHETQIVESERYIEELKAFLRDNDDGQN